MARRKLPVRCVPSASVGCPLRNTGCPATTVLAEALLDRGADADVAEAEAAIDRLVVTAADDGLVMRDIWLLRLRALLARGDSAAYTHFRDDYRDMAKTLG